MKYSLLMIINGLFALLGGLGLLTMPVQILEPYGASLTLGGIFISQLLGVLLLSIAIISVLLRNTKDRQTKNILNISFLVTHVGSAGLGLQAVNSGVLNSMVWFDVVVHGLLAGAFAYFLFGKKG